MDPMGKNHVNKRTKNSEVPQFLRLAPCERGRDSSHWLLWPNDSSSV